MKTRRNALFMLKEILWISLRLDINKPIKIILEIFTSPIACLLITCLAIVIIASDIEISVINIRFSWRFRNKRTHVAIKFAHPAYIPLRIIVFLFLPSDNVAYLV
ncbi:hypothetical protein ERO13_D02G019651v2 [Gossypium hirsutum]|uniref:Uncharacterized protein n=1 Tax=Gossypium barbadense TaxID=3634 RepID=A0A5J5SCC9_GOSBA|nr:hypothetical protein ES319_D02G023300v1 [Gossypium barbadense]KAG4156792.1 hypothetical protein ERO13_D02G019651v2 [Gossypium hirsutum]